MSNRWESPIEYDLMVSLRMVGLQVQHQVRFGPYQVDMVVFSRLNNRTLIVECDVEEYYHSLIDDFRDDELRDLSGYPVVHITGSAITRDAEGCVISIVDRWFPEHIRLVGYSQLRDISIQRNKKAGLPSQSVLGSNVRDHEAASLKEKRDLIRKTLGNKKVSLFELARLYILEENKDDRFPEIKERELRKLDEYINRINSKGK